jgi:predicted dehydrogenase
MKQVVQEIRSGTTDVREIPAPVATPGQVIVATVASLVSAGTERYVVELAKKSLIGKARERPDHVKRILQKLKEEGFFSTVQQVVAKLDEPMPLGYSAAGVVLECGRGVQEFKPGDRVACVGPHAGVVSVSRNLCARLPDGVTFEQAAYTSVSAIALEGIRLAKLSLGDRVLVVGLGLIGQIAVCLLKFQGCRVFGVDLDEKRLALAAKLGADRVAAGSPVDAIKAFSGEFGVDATVITAATPSNGPIELAAAACRPKGRIVLVGVVGLNLPRPPFFEKELEFTVSSSMGPGRADPAYEEKAQDYPIGYARWTAQRNMEAVLEVMAAGKLPVEQLTTHRLPIQRAPEAYELISSKDRPSLGVIIEYPATEGRPPRKVSLRAQPVVTGGLGVSMIGAGNFARLVLLPLLSRQPGITFRGLCTARGMTAQHNGERRGFTFATTDAAEVIGDVATRAILIATRHDLHADLLLAALRAGKHVFVEKPLCIRMEELQAIEDCVEELGADCPILTVGLNRRFAPATRQLSRFFHGIAPLSIAYRFAPGPIPKEHWAHDEDVGGGRLVGEACHAIDTCVAIANSLPRRVFAESVGSEGVETSDDRAFVTIRHENGSLSSISYQAGGDRAFPSERIEIFGGGKVAVLDSWDELQLWSGGRMHRAAGKHDKGHANEIETFLSACQQGGEWPISWDELRQVAAASLLAVQSLRDGLPQTL